MERNGRYEEADGKVCDTASHRYVLQLKALDISGPAYLSIFNEQVRRLGMNVCPTYVITFP